MRTCALLLSLALMACDPAPALPDVGPPGVDAGGADAGADAGPAGMDAGPGPLDAGPPDAGPRGMDAGLADAGAPDAGRVDAGRVDAGRVDAGRVDAGAPDAGAPDAGFDAGAPDAGPPGTTPVFFECHPVVLPQQSSGLSVSDNFFTGFRFQVPAGPPVTTSSIGLYVEGGSPVFGAIVALTGPTDWPDTPNLTSPDILGTAVIPFAGSPASLATAPLSVVLSPGWYMAIYGKGGFGAPAGFANVRNNVAGGACVGGGAVVTVRQSDGFQITQSGVSPHFQVTGTR